MTAPFRRTLPPEPDLGQQRTLAKELLRAFRAGDAEAAARVRAALPDKQTIKLADAQFVLAREYGFASWPALVREIEARPNRQAGPPLDAMRAAVSDGDARALRRLLARHAELRAAVNEPLFSFDSPALVHVARRADASVVDVLLEFGADPNRRSAWWAGGFHPLHGASAAAAERLLAAGAVPDACAAAHLDQPGLLERLLRDDPARVHERGGDGQTPLHFARSREVVDLLLDAGADLDARDVDHRSTPAQWMLERRRGAGRYEIARYLVERGATADIFLAAALGLTDRLRALLDADPALLGLRTGRGPYGERPPSSFHIYTWTIGQHLSPLQVAAQFEQEGAVGVLRAHASPMQRFLAACVAGDEAEARTLLGAHPHLLAELGPDEQSALVDAAWRPDPRAVALLIEFGFDPTPAGHEGGSALHCAAWQGSPESVAAILRHPNAPALLTVRDPTFGATPLGWCCHGSLHSGHPERDYAAVARLLVDAGAAVPDEIGPENAAAAVLAVLKQRD